MKRFLTLLSVVISSSVLPLVSPASIASTRWRMVRREAAMSHGIGSSWPSDYLDLLRLSICHQAILFILHQDGCSLADEASLLSPCAHWLFPPLLIPTGKASLLSLDWVLPMTILQVFSLLAQHISCQFPCFTELHLDGRSAHFPLYGSASDPSLGTPPATCLPLHVGHPHLHANSFAGSLTPS